MELEKCKIDYKLELWKKIKVIDCEYKNYLLERWSMVCYIDCNFMYLFKIKSDVYIII